MIAYSMQNLLLFCCMWQVWPTNECTKSGNNLPISTPLAVGNMFRYKKNPHPVPARPTWHSIYVHKKPIAMRDLAKSSPLDVQGCRHRQVQGLAKRWLNCHRRHSAAELPSASSPEQAALALVAAFDSPKDCFNALYSARSNISPGSVPPPPPSYKEGGN